MPSTAFHWVREFAEKLNFLVGLTVLTISRQWVVSVQRVSPVIIVVFVCSCLLLYSSKCFGAELEKSGGDLPIAQKQVVDQSTLPVKYWGNSFSLKFHRPSCPFAQAISADHVMFFNFRKQAVDSGQTPCRYCLPPFWTTVKASILPSTPSTKSAQSSGLPTHSVEAKIKSPNQDAIEPLSREDN
jgi:hypothetical protein